jgi:hypothetical protein
VPSKRLVSPNSSPTMRMAITHRAKRNKVIQPLLALMAHVLIVEDEIAVLMLVAVYVSWSVFLRARPTPS